MATEIVINYQRASMRTLILISSMHASSSLHQCHGYFTLTFMMKICSISSKYISSSIHQWNGSSGVHASIFLGRSCDSDTRDSWLWTSACHTLHSLSLSFFLLPRPLILNFFLSFPLDHLNRESFPGAQFWIASEVWLGGHNASYSQFVRMCTFIRKKGRSYLLGLEYFDHYELCLSVLNLHFRSSTKMNLNRFFYMWSCTV